VLTKTLTTDALVKIVEVQVTEALVAWAKAVDDMGQRGVWDGITLVPPHVGAHPFLFYHGRAFVN
jgi:hypothetical protein